MDLIIEHFTVFSVGITALLFISTIVGIHLGRKVERKNWTSLATPGVRKPVLYIKNQGYVVMISEEFDMLNLIEVREGTATH